MENKENPNQPELTEQQLDDLLEQFLAEEELPVEEAATGEDIHKRLPWS